MIRPSSTIAGIEIGGTKIQIAVGNPDGKLLETKRFRVVPEKGAAGIRENILDGLNSLKEIHSFQKIGVGFGGPIDWKTGRIFRSHHIDGWNGFPLTDWLESTMGVEAVADNDANVAALAETRLGEGVHRNPVFYMTLGTGIGGGVVIHGKIYHGRFPGEVEIGHTRIPFPDVDPCDWPILESLCSGWSLDRFIRESALRHPEGTLARLIREGGGGMETRYLGKAKKLQDPEAERIWRDLCRYLGLALSHVVHLFHPEVLILGGGVSLLGEPLLREIQSRLDQIVMMAYRGTYELKLAGLGENAVPVGAILLGSSGHLED